MAPEANDMSEAAVRRYCGMGNHLLRKPNTIIRETKMLRFARYINPELRVDTPICLDCFKILERLYRSKVSHALRHKKKNQAESISDVSSSQRQDLTSFLDPSSTTSIPTIRRRVTTSASASSSSENNMPTTSAAAAEKRKRPNPPPAAQNTSIVSDDDDPNSNLSLNAVNGTRLPHIQPIPKRRQTVHLNKTAMEIYLAGTTGG
ncbi:uncharacterized protein LOC117579313 [Drosophila guanche]|uniref:Uncharacterized protein n=1 Tax=Drosophila guanche TaxID=7266 RepID=A0A3B0J423_DROGU|nr:uncharacterized protein LOC117579313 [Drosophila guanche]XP_034121017.1 uncharacterized protein LOC117579313 [Drosophila guanche]XP_034121018.1 uncharacterized protein LOC117579313 [Drosophila guanche]SPP76187.1 Hypothetical predicted protein [Drosophila guanche]